MQPETCRIRGWFAAGMTAAMLGGAIAAPMRATASEDGRKNTALGLGALSAYLFTRKGNKVPAFVAAAGAAYAYKRYDDAIKDRHSREARERAWEADRHHERAEFYRRHHGHHDNGLHRGWDKGKHKGWDKHHKHD